MEENGLDTATVTVINEVKEVKKELGILPGGLVIGFGIGFITKGITGAIIGGAAGAIIYKMYQHHLNK